MGIYFEALVSMVVWLENLRPETEIWRLVETTLTRYGENEIIEPRDGVCGKQFR